MRFLRRLFRPRTKWTDVLPEDEISLSAAQNREQQRQESSAAHKRTDEPSPFLEEQSAQSDDTTRPF